MAQTIKLKRSSTEGAVPATSALELGEVAINTYDGKMYIKKNDGSESVVEIGGSSSSDTLTSTHTTYEYVATSNQTTFSGSDVYSATLAYDTGTPAKIQVFLNGILLDEGSGADYTATNGTSVVLTTGATTGDLIQISAYKSEASVALDIDLVDDVKLKFGDDDDLQIYHDGSDSYITDGGTGDLKIQADDLVFKTADGSKEYLKGTAGGSVRIRHNNTTMFETTSAGVTVSGNVFATGGSSIQWNTAYTYSQVGHLPLAGGTLTGTLNGQAANFYNTVKIGGWLTGASNTNTLFSHIFLGTIIQTPSNTDNAAGSFFIKDSDAVTHFTLNTNTDVSTFTGTVVAEELTIDTQANISGSTVTTTSTSVTTVNSFAASTFRSARYTVQITNSTDSTYQITEILLIHNGTTPEITEYGSIHTGAAVEATFDADISSGSVRLRATPASGDTMAFKVVRHSIIV